MSKHNILKAQILIVKNDEIVALDMPTRLEALGFGVYAVVHSGAEAIKAIKKNTPDLVLMDITRKDYEERVETAERIRNQFKIPVVYLVADADEKMLGRAKTTESFGYITKPFDSRELEIVVEMALYKNQIAKADDALAAETRLSQTLFDALPCIALLLRPQFCEIVASNAAARKVGALPGKTCYKTWVGRSDPCPWCLSQEVWSTGKPRHLEVEAQGTIWDIHWFPIDDDLYLHYAFDITEKRQMEVQLQHAQKMEAIGTLAGGIAHDFNNILFPIIGLAEMLLDDTPKESPMRESIKIILNGAKRAAGLVKQILTFSRQAEKELKPLRIQIIIKEVLNLARSTLPATIEISQHISNKCGLVMADPTQIHQIMMNLITNAYHAMQESGGKLEVTLKEIELRPEDLPNSNMMPGPYNCLTVADTGAGMEKVVLDRIFIPYFTTKNMDKGTGLGLSMVHGIIKSYGGDIQVDSEPDQGTRFRVYLPVIEAQVEVLEAETDAPVLAGNEHILLVDDEYQVVQMEKQMLERLGYQVTARTGSIDALEAFRASPDKFDLVIADMAMPNMTGVQLSQKLLEIRSNIKIIICTGFSEQLDDQKAKMLGLSGYVMKPVVKSKLSSKIREVLDG